MALARSLGRHTLVYASGVLLQRLAGFVMLPLYTRALSRADYGKIGLIDFAVGMVALVVGLNLSEALIRIYNDFEEESAKRRAVSTAVLASGLLAASAAAALSLLATPLGPILFGAPIEPHLVVLALATMALDAAATPSFTYLRLLDRSGLYVLVSLGRLVVAVSLNLLWLGFLDGGLTAYFASGVVASGAQCVFLCAWTFRRAPLAISKDALARLLRFSLPLVPASACSLLLHSSSRWILFRAGSVEALGVFAVAWQLGNVVSNGIVHPFSLVWSTKFYEVLREPDGKKTVARVFLWFAVALAWGGVALSLLAAPFLVGLGFVGPGFALAARSVPLVALAYVIFGLGFVVHMGVFAAKRTGKSLEAAAVAAAVGIALNVLGVAFVPRELHDLVPAATGALSFLVLAALRYRFAQQLFPIPYDWPRAALIVLAGAGVVVLPDLRALPPALDIASRIGLAVVFPLIALAFLPGEERAIVFLWARKRTRGEDALARAPL